MKRALDHWFATQILPCEAGLMRYLRRVASCAADVPDLRQEVYMRVYEGAAKSLPQDEQRFLFVTARNLLIDRLRRERRSSASLRIDGKFRSSNADAFLWLLQKGFPVKVKEDEKRTVLQRRP
jgi:DNA-directed RNA polymerase specialized sigma24 family protein